MRIEDSSSLSGEAPPLELRLHAIGPRPDIPAPSRPKDGHMEEATDTASLSALSTELSRAVNGEPPEAVARIARLQEAVANGTYTVPSAEVSARIVTSQLDTES